MTDGAAGEGNAQLDRSGSQQLWRHDCVGSLTSAPPQLSTPAVSHRHSRGHGADGRPAAHKWLLPILTDVVDGKTSRAGKQAAILHTRRTIAEVDRHAHFLCPPSYRLGQSQRTIIHINPMLLVCVWHQDFVTQPIHAHCQLSPGYCWHFKHLHAAWSRYHTDQS